MPGWDENGKAEKEVLEELELIGFKVDYLKTSKRLHTWPKYIYVGKYA